MASAVLPAQAKQLYEEGWLLFKNVLSDAQLQAMHAAWDLFSDDENQNWDLQGLAEFEPCLALPVMLDAIRQLLGENPRLQSFRGRSPKAGFGQQGLHVDTVGPVDPDAQQLANAFWILDDMTGDNGATRLVPRSHRSYSIPQGTYAQPHGSHPQEILVSASAGDLLVFSAHLWHSGTRNNSGARRRVAIAQFARRGMAGPDQ